MPPVDVGGRVRAEMNISPTPPSARAVPVGSRGTGRRPRVAILSTWHPEPADNGRKQRTRRMIEALARDYEVALVSLLPPVECRATLPPVPQVFCQRALPLPTFAPASPAALAALLSPLPRSFMATWDAATAAALAAF